MRVIRPHVVATVTTGLRLLRSPRELPAMLVALTVGVGLSATAYSLIASVLLTPLPYTRPDRLVQIWNVAEQSASRVLGERDQADLLRPPSAFQDIANYGAVRQELEIGGGRPTVQVGGALVTANFFDVVGARPLTGRTFTPDERLPSGTPPVIVSEHTVRTGMVRGDLGATVTLDGVAHRLVGIMPDAFWFPDRQTDYWVILPEVRPEMRAVASGAISFSFAALGRLAEGTTIAAAEAQATTRVSEPGAEPAAGLRVGVESHAALVTAPVRSPLLMLQIASGLVMLLVCLNVGWLFRARAKRLGPAFQTMRALGATSAQVVGTHFVSAVCVAVLAAPLAVLAAWVLLRFGLTLESGVFTRTAEPAITWHVIVVTGLVTLLASVASCVPGALAVSALKGSLSGQKQNATRPARSERASMIVQVGLVFAVGAQAVLVALVLRDLMRTNVGFPRTDFLVVSLTAREGMAVDRVLQVVQFGEIVRRLEQRGIRAAAAGVFPFTGGDSRSTFEPRRSRDQQRTMIRIRAVTPSYFDLTGLTAMKGRLLMAADAGLKRVVVTEAFAAAVRPGSEVIGRRVGQSEDFTVVGVVPPVRQFAVTEEAQPEAYVLFEDHAALPSSQAGYQRVQLLAPIRGGIDSTLQVVRQELAQALPEFEIRTAVPFGDLVALNLGATRLVVAGAVVFAVVAVLLSALGLFAMVSHSLRLREREIGIRLALGATARRIAVESVAPITGVYTLGIGLGMGLLVTTYSAT